MSQPVALDELNMRTQSRPQRLANGAPAYSQRPLGRPSRQLFQGISSALVTPAAAQATPVVAPPQPPQISTQIAWTPPAPSPTPVSVSIPSPQPKQFFAPAKVATPIFSETLAPILRSALASQQASVPLPQPQAPILPASTAVPSPVHTPRPFELPPNNTKHQPLFHPKHHRPEEDMESSQKQALLKLSRPVTKRKMGIKKFKFGLPSRSTLLTGMAVAVFVVGMGVSLTGFLTTNVAQAQAEKLSKALAAAAPTTTNGVETAPPSTAIVSANSIEAYKVAADLPRLIRISKLGVYARVLQVGATNTGALATPTNVFDTAWYKGSAKPGQPGATLIDGHVSSWTTNGVFYGIKNLVPGDNIEIVKGDNTTLEYTVVKTTAYPVNSVDMKALQTPVTAGRSGLNLITCGGKYDSKAGEFTQRIAVFATLNS